MIANLTTQKKLEHSELGGCARMPDFSSLAHESGVMLVKVMGTYSELPLPLRDTIHQFAQWVRAGQEKTAEAQQPRVIIDKAGYQIHESGLNTRRFLVACKMGEAI